MTTTSVRYLAFAAFVLLLACSTGKPAKLDTGAGGASGVPSQGAAATGSTAADAGAPNSTLGSSPRALPNSKIDGGAANPATSQAPRPNPADLVVKPDTSVAKTGDCASAPDMTLCDTVTMPDRWYDVCVRGKCVSPGCQQANCNASGPHFELPPMHGHDYFQMTSGDQPVSIDLVTGLHWTSCAAGLSGAGCANGTPTEMNLPDALAYCDTLQWGGHDDWYLPDVFELVSLVDVDSGAPGLISPKAFPNQQAVDAFYLSTTFVDNHVQVFSTGQNQAGFLSFLWEDVGTQPHSVLCVRRGFSGPMPAAARFVAHADAQPWVLDRTTGLSIQACTGSSTNPCAPNMHTGAEVTAYCDGLSWASKDDWRVPNYKEALALFDPLKSTGPGLDQTLFGQLSAHYVLLEGPALLDLYDASRVGIGIAANTYPVLCVRGP